MKNFLRLILGRCKSFLSNSGLVRSLVLFQHKLVPMPLVMFDWIFRSGFRRRIFDFYGSSIAKNFYNNRGSNQLNFWLSKESLYWHFWRQTDTDDRVLGEVLSLDQIKKKFETDALVVAELGFGMGKNYAKFLRPNNFKKYIAVEPNTYLCDYVSRKFESDKNLEVVNSSAIDFVNYKRKIDVLLCSGGVLMYLDKIAIDAVFCSLATSGANTLIILNEGTWTEDISREDGTTMYNFKKRLIELGFEKTFIENQKAEGIYSYFVMC